MFEMSIYALLGITIIILILVIVFNAIQAKNNNRIVETLNGINMPQLSHEITCHKLEIIGIIQDFRKEIQMFKTESELKNHQTFMSLNKNDSEVVESLKRIDIPKLSQEIIRHKSEIMGAIEDYRKDIQMVRAELEIKCQQIFMSLNKDDKELSPLASEWILSNGSISKHFKPGNITHVINSDDKSKTEYEFKESGEVSCTKYIDGVIKMKTDFSSYGSPLRGFTYSDGGQIQFEYTYDKLGQIEKTIRQ